MTTANLKQPTANRSSVPAKIIADAVAALRVGELAVYPTETFYAIGADPMQAKALAALGRVKGREPGKPVALIAGDPPSAWVIAREIPAGARLLAETFWPGPLTLVLPARSGLDEALVGPGGGVGVRVSLHPIARRLAAAAGGLITATSANLSGEPPARTIIEAEQSLGARVRAYVDGGLLSSEFPSTIVEFGPGNRWQILRNGAIDGQAISTALGKLG